jgi:hypothetical protein
MWTSPLNKKRSDKSCQMPAFSSQSGGIGGSDFELAMYFIDNAMTLEKIIIDPRYQSKWHSISRIEIEEEEQELEQTRKASCRAAARVKSTSKSQVGGPLILLNAHCI